MTYFSSPGKFLIVLDSELAFFQKSLHFLLNTKQKNASTKTSFEIDFDKNTTDSKGTPVGILKMRHTESHSVISESSLTVSLQLDPPMETYNFYGWINIGQLASALKRVQQNDKLVFIAFDSDSSDNLIVRYEPHPNKPGMKSTILRDTILKFTSHDEKPSEFFFDTEFALHAQSVKYRFNIQPVEFSDNISLIAIDKTATDPNQKLDPENQKVELEIYYVCPNFTWIKIVVANELSSSMCQMMCPNTVVPTDHKPMIQRDLIFQQPILFRSKYLHKRFAHFLSNFNDSANVQINISDDPAAPLYMIFFSDYVNDDKIQQFNYLKSIIVPQY